LIARRVAPQFLYGNRNPDATDGKLTDSMMLHLNRRTSLTRHARDLLSGRPASFAFCCLLAKVIKDSGFRIGEEYSRYASLFLYRTE
ncbi:MAG: hypothetical protein OXU98_06080, partial [Gammaproteobacteria bacterium]|nr:hypothetical protein [Gammaproteobacteria bacterium]